MEDMKDALSKYFRVYADGGGSPVHAVGTEGVRQGGYNVNAGAEARIPIDALMKDALLKANVDAFHYRGNVEFPEHIQAFGMPAEMSYGDTGINNVGAGIINGGFSAGGNYNPQTNEKSVNARYKFDF
tara:strand:- start:30 stop:413 length:384 start_codon:yes stop_codon:yes gene_type:complete